MQKREQYLLAGLIAVFVLWQGAVWFSSAFLQPIRDKRQQLAELTDSIDKKNEKLIDLARAKKDLANWRLRSLPPDPTKPNQRPDAINAQRLYQDWLHDLAQLCGFEDLKVAPDRRTASQGNVFVAVGIKIEADARYEQLCNFLDHFYRTDLMHRVASLHVTSREAEGDPFLHCVIEAEGLAITGAEQRRRLFPQTQLASDVADDATAINVESMEGFPKSPGFLVRLKNEYLTVTAVDGNKWTAKRGRERTIPANYQKGTIAELTPLNPAVPEWSPDEFQKLLKQNIFSKPAPPAQYKLKLAPLGEKTFTRGKPVDFSIVALGFDPTRGRPEFVLTGSPPTGAKLDKSTGRFSWTPPDEQKAGSYPVKFEVRHPTAPGGRLVETVNIVLRDANTPPKFATQSVPPAYIGREWKFIPEVNDAESKRDRLTWKLNENSPSGMKINASTGEISWTPDESTDVGDVTVQVTASDDGMPPLSATLDLKLSVQDDAAQFTKLVGIFAQGGDRRAILYDPSQNKRLELREGNTIAVTDIKGTVKSITGKYLLFSVGTQMHRLELGQSLRETTVEPEQFPDATQPANGPIR
jgi:Putative Ig domain